MVRLLGLALAAGVIWLVISQIIVPAWLRMPLFPLFWSKTEETQVEINKILDQLNNKQAEEDLVRLKARYAAQSKHGTNGANNGTQAKDTKDGNA